MADTKYLEEDLYMFSKDLYKWQKILTTDGMLYKYQDADFLKVYKTFDAMQKLRIGLYEAFGMEVTSKYKEYKGESEYDENDNMICDDSIHMIEENLTKWKEGWKAKLNKMSEDKE